MVVTKQTNIGAILDADPTTGKYFMEIGMHCLGCPSARGENIEQGKKSLAYSLSFRSKDGTLTDADIDIDSILAKLKDAFGAELRA